MSAADRNAADRLISHFGSNITHAAQMCGQSKQTVWAWRKRGAIPPRWATVVETATQGKITSAEILREHEINAKMKSKRGRKK